MEETQLLVIYQKNIPLNNGELIRTVNRIYKYQKVVEPL